MQYPSTEFTDAAFALEPSFSPPDAPSPEVFDQEFAELDLGLPYAEQSDGFFTSTTFRDFRPVISPVSGPLTYSTTCVYGETSSHYSSDLTRSGHLTSDVQVEALEGYSSNNGLPGTHDIHSAVFSNGPPFVPPLHGAEDEFAFGTSFFSPNFAGITSEDSSTAVQLPFTPPHSVHQMTPDSEAQEQMAPTPDRDRPFKCPQSPHCKEETI